MSHLPLHAPRVAPAVLATTPAETGRAASVLLAVAAAALTGASVLAVTAPGHRPATSVAVESPVVTAPLMARVAAVIATEAFPAVADLAPPHPGWHPPPVSVISTMLGSSLPQVAAVEDRAGEPPPPAGADALPAVPLTLDPAVAAAIARLRDGAADPRRGVRPAPAALVAMGRALDQVGDPYVWGATGPDSFDCSGLMWWSYAGADVYLPRLSRDQAAGGGQPVPVAELLPGDLVFFAAAAWDPGVVHHVGMYVGDGLMVDAPRPGEQVRVELVPAEGYAGAVRPVPAVTGDGGRPRHHSARQPSRPVRPGAAPAPTPIPTPTPTPPAPAPEASPAQPDQAPAPGNPGAPTAPAAPAAPPVPADPAATPTPAATLPDPTPTVTAPPTSAAPTVGPLVMVPLVGTAVLAAPRNG